MTTNYSFKKEERLCSKKAISELFAKGNSSFHFPFRVLWLKNNEAIASSIQLAISVPKKNFKKAYQRNRIKRLIKEAWRLNKHKLYEKLEPASLNYVIMIIYVHTETPDYKLVLKQTGELISKLLLILPSDSKNEKI